MMNTIFKKIVNNQSNEFDTKGFKEINKYKLWKRSILIKLMNDILKHVYKKISDLFNSDYKNKLKYFNRTNKGFYFFLI